MQWMETRSSSAHLMSAKHVKACGLHQERLLENNRRRSEARQQHESNTGSSLQKIPVMPAQPGCKIPEDDAFESSASFFHDEDGNEIMLTAGVDAEAESRKKMFTRLKTMGEEDEIQDDEHDGTGSFGSKLPFLFDLNWKDYPSQKGTVFL